MYLLIGAVIGLLLVHFFGEKLGSYMADKHFIKKYGQTEYDELKQWAKENGRKW